MLPTGLVWASLGKPLPIDTPPAATAPMRHVRTACAGRTHPSNSRPTARARVFPAMPSQSLGRTGPRNASGTPVAVHPQRDESCSLFSLFSSPSHGARLRQVQGRLQSLVFVLARSRVTLCVLSCPSHNLAPNPRLSGCGQNSATGSELWRSAPDARIPSVGKKPAKRLVLLSLAQFVPGCGHSSAIGFIHRVIHIFSSTRAVPPLSGASG